MTPSRRRSSAQPLSQASLVKERAYPHVPKSTKTLQLGDFWAIPLDGGEFACGRVISFKDRNGKQDLRMFLGLVCSTGFPLRRLRLRASRVRRHSYRGKRTCARSWPRAALSSATARWSRTVSSPPYAVAVPAYRLCRVLRGFDPVRPATPDDIRELPVLVTFGLTSMRQRANSKLRRSA